MQFIQLTENARLDGLLSPAYYGYLSNTIKGANLPENYLRDFPRYISPRNVQIFDLPEPELPEDFKAEYVIKSPSLPIYEKTILYKKYNSFRCDDPEILKLSLATVFRNIMTGGSCLLAWEFSDLLYDYIHLLRAGFSVVNIHKGFFICTGFCLKNQEVEAIIDYFRYAIDCPAEIHPFIKISTENSIRTILAKLLTQREQALAEEKGIQNQF